MMEKNKQDLRITGSGTSSGGEFAEVRISGSGNIEGNVKSDSLSVIGSGKVAGDVKSDSCSVNGALKIQGELQTKSLKVNGSVSIQDKSYIGQGNLKGVVKLDDDLQIDTGQVTGSLRVKGNLRGNTLVSFGRLHVEQDCEVEEFQAKEGFEINGLLNAEKIDIYLSSQSKVKEMGGEKIHIRQHDDTLLRNVLKKMFSMHAFIEVDVIEGDEINLEATRAKVVRGNHVVIGKGCQIGLVEYTGSLNIKDGAEVEQQEKH